jgi:hypothetical protein
VYAVHGLTLRGERTDLFAIPVLVPIALVGIGIVDGWYDLPDGAAFSTTIAVGVLLPQWYLRRSDCGR